MSTIGYSFPKGIIFQQLDHNKHVKVFALAKIKDTTDFEHGTYQTQPYYTFIRSQNTGKEYLVSDTGLRAELTFIARQKSKKGNDGARFKLSFENVTTPVNYPDAILSFNDPSSDEECSFIVSGTAVDFDFLPHGKHPFGVYTPSLPRTENDQGNTVELGSPFAPKQAGFNLLLQSWDLTQMDLANIPMRGQRGQVLELPAGQTYNYDQQGHLVVPYGWSFRHEPAAEEKDSLNMITSSVDIMNAMQKVAGFHVSAGVEASMPGLFDASESFSLARTDGVQNMNDTLYQTETTVGTTEAITMQAAFVLDKRNAHLSNDFKQAIEELRSIVESTPGGVVPDEVIKGSVDTKGFIQLWGTHYIYAATFGTRTVKQTTYTKEHIKKLISAKVDVKSAWSASVKAVVFGIGGHVEGGQEKEESKQAEKEFNQATEHQNGVSHTVGGPESTAPIYVDLRPLSDLLGPPFYTDETIAVTLRDQIAAALPVYAFENVPAPSSGVDQLTDAISFYKIECSVPVMNVLVHPMWDLPGDPPTRLDARAVGDTYKITFPPGSLVASTGTISGDSVTGPLKGASAIVVAHEDTIPIVLELSADVVGEAPFHAIDDTSGTQVLRPTGRSSPISQPVAAIFFFDAPRKLGTTEIQGLVSQEFIVSPIRSSIAVRDPLSPRTWPTEPGTWPTEQPVVMGPVVFDLQLAPFGVSISRVDLKSTLGLSD